MFPVYYGEKECGSAVLEKQGLYYRISCKCKIPVCTPCRIELSADGKKIDLGTCIKDGNTYILNTKIPVKHLLGKDLSFTMDSGALKDHTSYYPVSEDAPIPHLNRLEKARLVHMGEGVGIVFTK